MYSGQDHQIDTDIAIIGGGTAGLNTAMAAAEGGLQVLVVDKANINRSGAIAGGIDHFMAFLETGEPWDTPEAWLKYVGGLAKGAANLKIHEAVFCKEVKAGIERVERSRIRSRRAEQTLENHAVVARRVRGRDDPLVPEPGVETVPRKPFPVRRAGQHAVGPAGRRSAGHCPVEAAAARDRVHRREHDRVGGAVGQPLP